MSVLYSINLGIQFEEAFTLRSLAIHLHHCDCLEDDPVNYEENSKEFGVNYRSKLLELKYFNACSGGMVADVMHDLLEGTLQYEAKLVLKHVTLHSVQEFCRFIGGFRTWLHGNGRQTHYDTITCNQLR